MLRAILLYLSKSGWARRLVTGWKFTRRAAERFVAGETLEQALAQVERLSALGMVATLDHLGEDVSDLDMAARARDDYLSLLDQIHASGSRSNVSLKLTQLGLNLDFQICLDHLLSIAKRANELGTFFRIDMEDSSTIASTLEIHDHLCEEGLDNAGLVFQSYMFRSEADLLGALECGTRVRLVKGAYREKPEIAYQRRRDVDANFDHLTKITLDHALSAGAEPISADGKVPPFAAVATHDEARIEFARSYADQIGLPASALEFQMLFGIRQELQQRLVALGHPVRIYIPYGTEWYPYYMRRLAERPANLWFPIYRFLRG